MCCTWLAGRQPIVSLLQANMHHCIWNAMSFLDSSSSEMDQNAFIASIFKKNSKAFGFLISSVARRGSVLACYWSQAVLDQCVHCDAIRCGRWPLSRARLSLWYDDQSRETSRVITFSTTGVVLTKCSSTLQVASLPWWCIAFFYCGQWFGLIARRELITQLLQAYEACHWIAPIFLERYSFLGRHCLLLHVQYWTVGILRTFVRWLSCQLL